jgi:hypothetical protein
MTEKFRVVYFFDAGGKFLSAARQSRTAGKGPWRNEARWGAADKPSVPCEVMAEARRRAKLLWNN